MLGLSPAWRRSASPRARVQARSTRGPPPAPRRAPTLPPLTTVRTSRAARSPSRTSRARPGRASSTRSTRPSDLESIGFVYEPLVYVERAAATRPRRRCWRPRYQWSADKKSIVFTIRDGVKWSDGQPFTADDVAFTFNLMKQIPAHRPLLAVDRRPGCRASPRPATRSRWPSSRPAQPYFYNFADQVGIVPQHIWSHRRRRRAPGHLDGPEPGRHRPVHGQPVHARTTSSTPPTRTTGSPASRTSRRSSTRPTWTTARPTSTWPAARRSGAASSSPNIQQFYLDKSQRQPHLVAAGH